MKTTGSHAIIEVLIEQGVDTVFGYPGGAIMPLYDALYDAPLRHILTVHEQGAAHAADGYARASGKVGVCIATSGPGATNLVTGLATAYMDSVPIVAITGQVGTSFLGRDAFQGVDVTGITMPITKHNYLVQDVSELADILREAFMVAREGRPGPILIDIPRNVLTDECEFQPAQAMQQTLLPLIPADITETSIDNALTLLLAAKRPVMIVGGGIKSGDAHVESVLLAKTMRLPVVSTLMGLGIFPTANPLFLGLTGIHGHRIANCTITGADLILAVGTRFSDRVTGDRILYAADKIIIQLDVDASEIGRNLAVDVELVGNLRFLLSEMIKRLNNRPRPDFTEWWNHINTLRHSDPLCLDTDSLNPQWIMRHMSDAVATHPVVWVTDVGQHQMWAAQHLDLYDSRSWITSGGMGTMGFGLPAAMGAQFARPGSRVIAVCGDGGFKMTGMELYTIATHNIPVICVIIDNHSLGMVRQLQTVFCESRYTSVKLPAFDFVGFARICGVRSLKAGNPGEFAAAFARALSHKGPTVIVADISPQQVVDPMVKPGQAIDQFVSFG